MDANDALWEAITARSAGLPQRRTSHFVVEDLAGLVERYFTAYPERRRAVVDRGIREVMDFYAARLSSEYHEASLLIMLVGIEGEVRSVTLGRGVRLRRVTRQELERLFLLEQDDFAAFSADELRSWHYCFEILLRLPRSTRPTARLAWEVVGDALTAVRMATGGRIGGSIAWLVPGPGAMLDTADRMQSARGYLNNPIPVSLTLDAARRARAIFRKLDRVGRDETLLLALRRYNFAVERD